MTMKPATSLQRKRVSSDFLLLVERKCVQGGKQNDAVKEGGFGVF
jgi:hypothetical protein